MEPLTLKRALHILHVRTHALQEIRRLAGDRDSSVALLADLSTLAGHALTIGPSESQLVALLANLPTPCETGGGLACPRCGWDSLQPSDDPPETVARHKHGCRAYIAQECAVAIECEHGFSVCSVCDRCTCNDALPEPTPKNRRARMDANRGNPCEPCGGSGFVTVYGGGWIACDKCEGSGVGTLFQAGPVAVVSPEIAAAFGLQAAAHVKIRSATA